MNLATDEPASTIVIHPMNLCVKHMVWVTTVIIGYCLTALVYLNKLANAHTALHAEGLLEP